MRAFLLKLRRLLRRQLIRRILPDLHAERSRSGELAPVLSRVAAFRRDQGQALIDRAIARGELDSAINRDLALDLLPSPLYGRMIILRRATNRDEIDRQVIALVAALKAP